MGELADLEFQLAKVNRQLTEEAHEMTVHRQRVLGLAQRRQMLCDELSDCRRFAALVSNGSGADGPGR